MVGGTGVAVGCGTGAAEVGFADGRTSVGRGVGFMVGTGLLVGRKDGFWVGNGVGVGLLVGAEEGSPCVGRGDGIGVGKSDGASEAHSISGFPEWQSSS